MKEEIWKDIEGFEGLYQVSSFGNIKSLPRKGTVCFPKILKPGRDSNGYLFVTLSRNNVRKHCSIHVLVAKAFIPNPENKPTVNHEDGDKTRNVPENLTWATYKEQLEHSLRTGLRKTQCNVQRKCCIVYPDNSIEYFDAMSHLSDKLGYKKSYCQNRIKKYGPVFYEKEKMIVIMDMVSIIPTYTAPSIYDVNLITYCKIKNLNYSTVRGRIRRGWGIEKAVTSTPSTYIEYVVKEGDKNGV